MGDASNQLMEAINQHPQREGTTCELCICIYGHFLKWGYPQIIHFTRVFPYKPSIHGYPHLGKPPHQYHRCFHKWTYPNSWLNYNGTAQSKIDDHRGRKFQETSNMARNLRNRPLSDAKSTAIPWSAICGDGLNRGCLIWMGDGIIYGIIMD